MMITSDDCEGPGLSWGIPEMRGHHTPNPKELGGNRQGDRFSWNLSNELIWPQNTHVLMGGENRDSKFPGLSTQANV